MAALGVVHCFRMHNDCKIMAEQTNVCEAVFYEKKFVASRRFLRREVRRLCRIEVGMDFLLSVWHKLNVAIFGILC